ncbi:CD36 family [Popillia japonica]|uniref:CD36 family n=1 Tax=Popillia japonica TaxID=7064 RepID=A0AAW1MLD2_POPJA
MYQHCPAITAITGFVVLAVGVLCAWYGFPSLIDNRIAESIALRDGTQAFDFWKKQPFPINYKVYFFNVTNPKESSI